MFKKLLKWLRSMLNQMFDTGNEQDIALSEKMSSAIDMWARMYENGGPWCNAKTGIHSCKLPSIIASEFARLVTIEIEVDVTGSPRADFLQQQMNKMLDRIRSYAELGCALGGIVFKPYVQDGKIIIDAVQGDDFFPTSFDASGRMTGCIFVEQIRRKNSIFTRAEHHEYQNGTHTIQNRAFESHSSDSIGTPIDLSAVPEWAQISPDAQISNVDRPLFAYFRVPQANRQDRHSPLGTSVFADAVETIHDFDEQYGRYLWEYRGGEMALDVADDYLRKSPDGECFSMPERDKRLYRGHDVPTGDQTFYQIFAPALRDESFARGMNTMLKQIEMQVGLAYGTLSDPQNVAKTATEINASRQRSYCTVKDIQKALQNALDDLIYSMDKLATLYNLAPQGSYQTAYDWDDSIVNEPSQRKQMFWQYVIAGKFPFWRYLMEFESYTEEDAKAIAGEAQKGQVDPFADGKEEMQNEIS
ncbi:capsid protein [Caproicibacterium amylolyticum]|uniref:Capsid protein n=1 Tax=Caproicibacterium amylolyticum TaxID=2766537 RepID=A0A7G9WJG0_9FIRM|nr:capsid protein [Caproicibacterium amylolyticum]QNO18822.1 capsid protein [Caproicibacterium amylolyticum]